MALIISDRVKETTTTSGTGSITLGGAVGGFVSFDSAIGEGNKTYYVIENDTKWEIGVGTYSSGSLSRDTVLSSSSGGGKISLSGVSFVFVALPSSKTVVKDEDGSFNLDADISTDNISVEKYSLLNDITATGDIISSGLLTMVRTTSGNFFHSYVNDSNKRTLCLYTDATSAPEWRLGLKSSPNNPLTPPTYAYVHGEDGNIGLYANSSNYLSLTHGGGFSLVNKSNSMFTSASVTGTSILGNAAAPEWRLGLKSSPNNPLTPPTYAYVHGEDGNIGLYANSSNYLSLTHGGGFSLVNKSNSMFTSASVTGTSILGNAAAYPSLIVKSAVSQAANIQEWRNSSDSILVNIDKDGSLFVGGADIVGDISANSASGAANAADIIVVSGIANAGGLPVASGSFVQTNTENIESNTNLIIASGNKAHDTATSASLPLGSGASIQANTSSIATNTSNILSNTNTISASGNANKDLITSNTTAISASGNTNRDFTASVSGWASSSFGVGGGSANSGDVLANSASGVAISGYNQSYTDIKVAALVD